VAVREGRTVYDNPTKVISRTPPTHAREAMVLVMDRYREADQAGTEAMIGRHRRTGRAPPVPGARSYFPARRFRARGCAAS
jgi:hypothetical protein